MKELIGPLEISYLEFGLVYKEEELLSKGFFRNDLSFLEPSHPYNTPIFSVLILLDGFRFLLTMPLTNDFGASLGL